MTEADDDTIIVPGSTEWLGEMVKMAMTAADEARRRFYTATDEVARLRRDLSAAEERLATAEREYHARGKFMHEVWDQLRGELENARRLAPADGPAAIPVPAVVKVGAPR